MKKVTAYESENGNLHRTMKAAAVDDLMSMFQADNNRSIQTSDIHSIVKNRSKVIPILLQADGNTAPPLLDPKYFRLGSWDCENSPTKHCAYTHELGEDCCIFCGGPHERK